MQIQIDRPLVHELTIELRPRPSWVLVLLAALYLGIPRRAVTGESWGRNSPDGGNNLHPVASGVVTRLTVTGSATQNNDPTASGNGWPPAVILGRSGVGRDTIPQRSVVLVPMGTTTGFGSNMVGIGTTGSETPDVNGKRLFYIRGHVRGGQCIWIRSSARCVGDWQ